MSRRVLILTTAACFAAIGTATMAGDVTEAEPIDHKVVTRVDAGPAPTALEPTAVTPHEGGFNQNVVTAGKRPSPPNGPVSPIS